MNHEHLALFKRVIAATQHFGTIDEENVIDCYLPAKNRVSPHLPGEDRITFHRHMFPDPADWEDLRNARKEQRAGLRDESELELIALAKRLLGET